MAQVLIDAGAEINGPLVAAASIDNAESAEALLDAGAEVNGTGGWSPLEEALYWGNNGVIDLDKKVDRTAAGWAEYGGHKELKNYLERTSLAQS